MKRIILLFGVCAIAVGVMAGAPANNTITVTTAAATVDSQWTSTWFLLDSMVLIKTDSCETFYLATATVLIKPGQKLYYGIKDGGAGVLDTHILQLDADADSAETVQIGVFYQDSLLSATDARDTIQFVAAVSGSSKAERVSLTNIRITGAVFPRNQ